MAVVRRSLLPELADVRREILSLASLMTSRFFPLLEDRFVPAMDVITRGDDLLVRVEVPGIDLDADVDVSVERDLLCISGKRSVQREGESAGHRFRELRYGSFARTFLLPEGVGPDDVSAEYRDGIIEVKVAGGAKRMAAGERRQIPVRRAP